MPINIIDTLKPKNNGSFPVVEAIDIAVDDELRLPAALAAKANADDLAETNAAVALKANATVTDNLQNQINQIEISASAESVVAPEVAAARVGEDSTSYSTLKERLDTEAEEFKGNFADLLIPLEATLYSNKQCRNTGLVDDNNFDTYKYQIPDGVTEVRIITNTYGNGVIIFTNEEADATFNESEFFQFPASGYNVPTDVNELLKTNGKKYVYVSHYRPSGVKAAATYNSVSQTNYTAIMTESELYKDVSSQNFITGFITNYGAVSDDDRYGRVENITLKKNQTIRIKAESNHFLALLYEQSGSLYLPLLIGDESETEYEYTAADDKVVGVSFIKNKPRDIFVFSKVADVLSKVEVSTDKISPADTTFFEPSDIQNLLNVPDGTYTSSPLTLVSSDNYFTVTKSTDMTEIVSLELGEVKLEAGDYVLNVFAEKNYAAAYNAPFYIGLYSGTILFQYAWVYEPSGRPKTFEVTAPMTVKVVLVAQYFENGNNLLNTEGHLGFKMMLETGTTAHGYVNPASNYYLPESLLPHEPVIDTTVAMFEKIGVIGDSYASGQIYLTGSPINYYNLSWGQVLARKNGISCTNFSRGGLTTKSWLTSDKGLELLLSSEAKGLYIIALGINDVSEINAGRYDLGTISDFDINNFDDTPDTFYGNMAKIIGNVLTKSPNCKIILSTMANNYQNTNIAVNNAIVACAGAAEIPVIKQYEDVYFTSDYYNNGMISGHPTAPVYGGMATAIERLINECISDNYDYFYDFVWSVE